MKKSLMFLAMTILLVSCSSKESETFVGLSWKDFQREVSLKGRVLDFNDAVMMPFGVQVFDSVLVTLEPAGDMVCQLFNLRTGEKIGDRLTKGEGPNEMIMPMFVHNGSGVRFVDLPSATIYNYDSKEFLMDSQPAPLSKVKLSEPVDAELQMLGKNYVGYQYFKEDLLYLFDESGQKTRPLAGFPESAGSMLSEERADAYQMGFVTNGKDRIAVAYYMTDVIEILDADGRIVKHIQGPDNWEYANGKDTYFSPKNAGDSFMVLYNGRSRMEEGHNSSCTKLLSFAWDGTPECVYALDDPIFTYCVDVKNRKVYGVSTIPEYHIVEYTLPE